MWTSSTILLLLVVVVTALILIVAPVIFVTINNNNKPAPPPAPAHRAQDLGPKAPSPVERLLQDRWTSGPWLRIGTVVGNGNAFNLWRRRDPTRSRVDPYEYEVRNEHGVSIRLDDVHRHLQDDEILPVPGFGNMTTQLLSVMDCVPCYFDVGSNPPQLL